MEEQREVEEIGQISFYLSKENIDLDAVIDWDEGLKHKLNFQQHAFTLGDAECQFLYFETLAPKANPPWLDFLNEQLGEDDKISFKAQSHSPNGILLIKLENRLFAAVFGRSAGSFLVRKTLELDFGIKTAMNMCGNEEIRQTRSQNNTLTPTHIDRQVNRPSDTFVFGLSEAEDLKFISAHMKDNKNITLQGRDSLTLKIIGAEKISWEFLIKQCRVFYKEYGSTAYVDLFPNYRNFKPADEQEALQLDGHLLEAIKEKRFNELQLCIPEFIADDEYSFSYTNKMTKDNDIYSHLNVDHLNFVINCADDLTIKKLQTRCIFAYSHAEDRILSYKKWPLYDCIIFEKKLDDKYFILTDGRWAQVEQQFYDTIVGFIRDKLRVEPCEDIFRGIEIADLGVMKNREGIFNEAVCRLKPESVLFDRAKLKIGNGRKDKEFCDILDTTDDGLVRIIHCKPFSGASSINYLFSQAKFYCEAFLHDETFLADIRAHIENSTSAAKDRYLTHIRPAIEEVRGEDYRICLWLLYDEKEAPPTKEAIPLIAQYELKLMHDHLRRVCKFNDIILRFVPVKRVAFKRALKPKAA